jgi:IS6 family transposase
MTERGLSVDHTTVWRWVQRYAPELERRVRGICNAQSSPGGSMRPMFGSPGRWIYLFRAVDSGGATLDFYLSENRDDGGCQAIPRQVLAAANHPRPRAINVDGNPSYPHAVNRLSRRGDWVGAAAMTVHPNLLYSSILDTA